MQLPSVAGSLTMDATAYHKGALDLGNGSSPRLYDLPNTQRPTATVCEAWSATCSTLGLTWRVRIILTCFKCAIHSILPRVRVWFFARTAFYRDFVFNLRYDIPRVV